MVQPAEHRRQQQQRVDDVESMVADQDHAAPGAEEPMQSLEVDDPVPVITTEHGGHGEERPGGPRLHVDRRTGDSVARSP
jgi:hypothetical protein